MKLTAWIITPATTLTTENKHDRSKGSNLFTLLYAAVPKLAKELVRDDIQPPFFTRALMAPTWCPPTPPPSNEHTHNSFQNAPKMQQYSQTHKPFPTRKTLNCVRLNWNPENPARWCGEAALGSEIRLFQMRLGGKFVLGVYSLISGFLWRCLGWFGHQKANVMGPKIAREVLGDGLISGRCNPCAPTVILWLQCASGSEASASSFWCCSAGPNPVTVPLSR